MSPEPCHQPASLSPHLLLSVLKKSFNFLWMYPTVIVVELLGVAVFMGQNKN
jgi:hypothetical protein